MTPHAISATEIISLISLAMNGLLAFSNAKVRADIAELKLYVHENFMPRRKT
jgi:hypothetical protein